MRSDLEGSESLERRALISSALDPALAASCWGDVVTADMSCQYFEKAFCTCVSFMPGPVSLTVRNTSVSSFGSPGEILTSRLTVPLEVNLSALSKRCSTTLPIFLASPLNQGFTSDALICSPWDQSVGVSERKDTRCPTLTLLWVLSSRLWRTSLIVSTRLKGRRSSTGTLPESKRAASTESSTRRFSRLTCLMMSLNADSFSYSEVTSSKLLSRCRRRWQGVRIS
mmetsp:Transcript_28050/g.68667  ORF Transcript_28050/g.68667 Transcript_28050/m.68667 type:complete len:226 (-) Transcript_28050:921-1598(-)